MTWMAAIKLLMGCPAIARIGVDLVRRLAEYIDEGRHEMAIKEIRQMQADIAAGKARNAASRATEEMMRSGRN